MAVATLTFADRLAGEHFVFIRDQHHGPGQFLLLDVRLNGRGKFAAIGRECWRRDEQGDKTSEKQYEPKRHQELHP